ncbi:hypothetical protein D9M73_173590 [compost metagenome]
MYAPQQHRGADHGSGGIPLPKYRKEVAEGAEQKYEVADVAQPGTDPVPPGGREAHVVAEPGLGIGIHPGLQLRLAIGQGLEHERQGQHADRGDPPTDQHGPNPCAGGHVLRQREDPAANHRADDKCN